MVFGTQPQRNLDEVDYLDPFQSELRLGYSNERMIGALADDLWKAQEGVVQLSWLLCIFGSFQYY